jgi:tetratricopeptide (TPR) repeat protein
MLGREGRYAEAIELMDKLTMIDPKSVLAHTNKSLYLMKLGKIQEAEEEKSLATVKSFQKFGEDAKLQTLRDEQNKRQELEWAQRESMFKQVLEIDPEDALANYGLGSIAVEKKRWSEAIAHLEKVIEHDPKYSVAYLALGKAYLGSGNKEKARLVWGAGIEIAAKNGEFMPANTMQTELSALT